MTPDRASIHGGTEAHRAAFHDLTPEQRDAMTAPLRTALESVNAQTAPVRATLAGLAAQAERMNRAVLPAFSRHAEAMAKCGDILRASLAAAEKAAAVERAVIHAAPIDRRPQVRHALRMLRRSGVALSDVDNALAAVHDFLTADTFGRLFPEGRAWGLAWAFARIIRGETVADLDRIAQDRLRLPAGRSLRNRGQRYEARTERRTPKRRERYARRPVPLSNRLAAHAPPRSGAHRSGAPTYLDRKDTATA